jgi:amidase
MQSRPYAAVSAGTCTAWRANLLGEAVTLGNSMEGMAALLAAGGNGYHWQGEYWPELAAAFERGFATSADELSAQVKLILLFGTHM